MKLAELGGALTPSLDVDLIRKYSIPGPRYTSYPPATQFVEDTEPLHLDEAIAEDNRRGGPLSLYFHLPFCETRCWFCGCNTVITKRRESAGEYLDDLANEMSLVAGRVNCSRPVTQIHLGGGTPTFLPPEQLRRLGWIIRNHFRLDAQREFSVEIDPRRLTMEHVAALHDIGANRASLGVQDTNPRVQLAVHRVQPHHLNLTAFQWLRAAGFRSINVDLIYGLPLQTPESFAHTIDDVLGLGPDRLSVFSYAHVPWVKPAQRIFDDREQLPDAEAKLAMFAIAHEKLTDAGYVDIGLDHFARPDDELAIALRRGTLHRNFQGYSTQADTALYGFGVSAISSTAATYRQNAKNVTDWKRLLDRGELPIERGLRLSLEDQRRRTVIMRVMCDRRLNFAALSEALDVDFTRHFAGELDSLKPLEADGLIAFNPEGLAVTRAGVPLLRVIAMHFDPTVKNTAHRHSRTI